MVILDTISIRCGRLLALLMVFYLMGRLLVVMSSLSLDNFFVQKVYAQDAVQTANGSNTNTLLNDAVFQGVITEGIIREDCQSIHKILGETDQQQFDQKVEECVSTTIQDWANRKQQCEQNIAAGSITTSLQECLQQEAAQSCAEDRTLSNGKCVCAFGETQDGECLRNDYGTLGINCTTDQLIGGNCSLNVSALLGIRTEQSGSNNIMTWLQDATLATTSFIGTVLTIGLIAVALRYIFGGVDQSFVGNAKKGFRYAIIGFFLVIFSYTIIRLVQYLAQG